MSRTFIRSVPAVATAGLFFGCIATASEDYSGSRRVILGPDGLAGAGGAVSAGGDRAGATGSGGMNQVGANSGGASVGAGGHTQSGGSVGETGGYTGTGGSTTTVDPDTSLHAKYCTYDVNASNGEIGFVLHLVNNATQSYPLSELTVHYYYTDDCSGAEEPAIWWAEVFLSQEPYWAGEEFMADIEITSQVLTPARSDADRYFAITFGSAYALDPAKHMVVKVHSYCPTGTYQENGDHSYLPSVVCPASGDLLESSVVHDRVEILSAGTPVWGS